VVKLEESTEASRALEAVSAFGTILAIKLYRLTLTPVPTVPILPCLDHEAMLHEAVASHAAAYIQESSSGDLHELVVIPARRRLDVDIVSTWGESSPESHQRFLAFLRERLPSYRVRTIIPSRWHGERRAANTCRAHVSLRSVLLGDDIINVKSGIERLQVISTLMEKQSRVGSWGVRTVTGPLLAAAGVITYVALGSLQDSLGESGLTVLRYTIIGVLGACFLYYGLKAVQLTAMSNRIWKRAAEYNLILHERRRLEN
jgi:hypothetical protein